MPASAWSALAASRDRDEQLAMIDLNVRALTELSLAFVDSLARHRGGILNVGSMAGFLPGPGMAVYYATKAYRAVVQRGAAQRTQAARRAGDACSAPARCRPNSPRAPASSSGLAPGFLTQSAEAVAEAGYRGLMQGKRRGRARAVNKLVIAADPACSARAAAGSRSMRGRAGAGPRNAT